MNFILIGTAGYIAPKHLDAIKAIGGNLLAAYDPHDSVGILDSYFPGTRFFTEFERFDRYIYKLLIEQNIKIDFVSICSPNYLHDAHIRYAFRIGADAICEKPLVLNPWNLDALQTLELETGKKVFNVLQLRYQENIQILADEIKANSKKRYPVELTYVTPRGNWYHSSWKGQIEKSGGILTNIGIHLFDILIWLFGDCKYYKLIHRTADYAQGELKLHRADVNWILSLRKKDIPENLNTPSHRRLKIGNKEIDFSAHFTNLHTKVYEDAIKGNGYRISDVRKAVQLVYDMRNNKIKDNL